MSTTCPKCQTSNPEDSKFCKECATPLQSKAHQFFSISPDFRFLTYTQQDLSGMDILLVENWR